MRFAIPDDAGFGRDFDDDRVALDRASDAQRDAVLRIDWKRSRETLYVDDT